MKVWVDIDGTICNTEGNNYRDAEPIQINIDKINRLYDNGHKITYWTARGGTTGKDWTEFTRRQLREWGCFYTELKVGGKPFDLIIDDKSKRIDEI